MSRRLVPATRAHLALLERYGAGRAVGTTPAGDFDAPSGMGGAGSTSLSRMSGGTSPSSRRYGVMSGDPYEQVARHQQEMGRRLPSSFDTPSAQMGRRSLTGKLPGSDRAYQDLRNDRSVYNAGSVAGLHETQAGSYGSEADPYQWDARHRFGYGQMGSRGAGYSDRWDVTNGRERTAGRLTTTSVFDQAVRPDRPYLQLRARTTNANGPVVEPEGSYEGNAVVRVTAGNFEDGQGLQVRKFWLGGGFVAVFDLGGWNNVRVNVLEILDGTFVEFAWTREGLHGGDRDLYYPEVYTTAATSSPVPDGAHSIILENPVPATPGTTVQIQWIGQSGGAVFTFTEWVSDNSPVAAFSRPYSYFGQPIKVKAPTYRIAAVGGAPATMGATIDALWVLRPI